MDVYPYNLEVRIDSIICLLYAAVVSNYFNWRFVRAEVIYYSRYGFLRRQYFRIV